MTENPASEFCVYNLDPHEYMGCVLMINEKYLAEYQHALGSVDIGPSQAIIVVGSDGKLERHAQSRTEFVLLGTTTEPDFNIQEITRALSEYHVYFLPTDDKTLERRIVKDEILSYVNNDHNLVYPDRVLNSTLVVGNKITQISAHSQVINEMAADGAEGKRIRKRLENQMKTHKHSILNGVSRDKQVFDITKSLQFYNESEGGTGAFGFKHAHIRAIQTAFNVLISRTVRHGILTPDEIATSMPPRTYDKFEYFSAKNLIFTDIAQPAQTAYAWFLREYHRIQEQYKDTHVPTVLPYNPDEFEIHNQVILEFLGRVFNNL